MKKLHISATVLALGAAALFSTAPVFADDAMTTTTTTTTGTVKCAGASACKGSDSCMVASEDDCTKAGGTVVKDGAATE